MIRRFVLGLMAAISVSLFAQQDQSVLVNTTILFGENAPPAVLDSSRGWTSVGTVDWHPGGIEVPDKLRQRRWRLKTVYEHQRSGGPATLQVRIRDNSANPVFTHPWSESVDRGVKSYSNWYEEAAGAVGLGNAGIIEARLIAPPRTPLTGTLYTVTIETWDRVPAKSITEPTRDVPDIQLAYARPLPTNRVDTDRSDRDGGPEEALAFALSFVESALTGDLAVYYRSQADLIRSLDDGGAMARYHRAPPAGIPGLNSIDDYKRRFDYRVYDSTMYGELFPEWFNESRAWTPEPDSYLFMGHRSRLKETIPEEVDFLVFLVGRNKDGQWKVIARPSQ